MELSKKDTKMLQGLSVLAMVFLHLFDRDYIGIFHPLLFLGGVPVSFYIAQLCDFCVFGFAFCSGYAHMNLYGSEGFYRRRLKGLLNPLISFWIIISLFSIVSILIGNGASMPKSASVFVLNFLTIESSLNGAWWYLLTYIVIVIISPAVLKIVKHIPSWLVFTVFFALYAASFYIRFHVVSDRWLIIKAGPFGMTLFEYCVGAIFCKESLFTRIGSYWKKLGRVLQWTLSVVLFAVMLYGHTKLVASLFIAPVTGTVIIMLFHFWNKAPTVERFFLLFGKHSTNIWLCHMFFYSYIFWDLVYKLKFPPAVYAAMLILSLLTSMMVQLIERPIKKLVFK